MIRGVYLKCRKRRKNGKTHRSWSVVESRRLSDGKMTQRPVLYLGELNDSQQCAWERTISVFDEQTGEERQMALFPADRAPTTTDTETVQVRLNELRLENPRQWGACWLGDHLWRLLQLDEFFRARLPVSREGTDWEKILRILVLYRLLAPGSEWRLHRHWFATTALGDLLGVNERAAQDDTLYRCHDLILPLKEELFGHLAKRWGDLFGARYDVLLYDCTSTYFECSVPEDENDPRRFGYSRDKRSDCVQVVIALVVTPEGLPLAYEMLPGNTADKTTLRGMLEKVRRRFGAAERIWVMDRGIPTEEILGELRHQDSTVRYLVGTPKGRLTRFEAALAERPWREVQPKLRVKLLPHDGEVYVLAQSQARTDKERAMRRRLLKKYWKRLGELTRLKKCPRDELLVKLGKAEGTAGAAAALVQVTVSPAGRLTYELDRQKLRQVRQREGRYLLRTNLDADDPELIWRCYMQLVFVEEAFRTLKGDLGLRPIFHKTPDRIEAHLFIAFLSYCLSITLRQHLRALAGGLMPRAVFEKFATLQMLDVTVPATDGRELLLVRRTEPSHDVQLLLLKLGLQLPAQAPPKIRYPGKTTV
jgi:hypothetical protein